MNSQLLASELVVAHGFVFGAFRRIRSINSSPLFHSLRFVMRAFHNANSLSWEEKLFSTAKSSFIPEFLSLSFNSRGEGGSKKGDDILENRASCEAAALGTLVRNWEEPSVFPRGKSIVFYSQLFLWKWTPRASARNLALAWTTIFFLFIGWICQQAAAKAACT